MFKPKLFRASKNKWLFAVLSAVFAAVMQISGSPLGIAYPLLMVPFFRSLLKSESFGKYMKSAVSFCLVYYVIQLSFIFTVYRVIPLSKAMAMTAASAAVIILTLWASLLMLIPLSFGYFFKNPYLKAVAIALLFVLGEHLQELSPLFAFPWSRTEAALLPAPFMLLTSKYLGGSFSAFVITLTSALLALSITKKSYPKKAAVTAIVAVGIFSANAITGAVIYNSQKNSLQSGKAVSVMIVQTSVEGTEKDYITTEAAAAEVEELIKENLTSDCRLIIIPETAIPSHFSEDSSVFRSFFDISKESGAVIAAGCFTEKDGGVYNSVIAIEPDGSFSECYDKSRLVPFGEYAPIFKDIFGSGEITPSQVTAPLKTSVGTLGVMICIESIYSQLGDSLVKDGAELMVVPTNDSWFGDSFGREMHFRHSVLRAIESGRYLVRSGNCGISAVISPVGEIIEAEYGKDRTVLHGKVYLNENGSSFLALHDVIILPAAIFWVWGICRAVSSLVKRNLKQSCGKWLQAQSKS